MIQVAILNIWLTVNNLEILNAGWNLESWMIT